MTTGILQAILSLYLIRDGRLMLSAAATAWNLGAPTIADLRTRGVLVVMAYGIVSVWGLSVRTKSI
jgi:hypothetical protein